MVDDNGYDNMCDRQCVNLLSASSMKYQQCMKPLAL